MSNKKGDELLEDVFSTNTDDDGNEIEFENEYFRVKKIRTKRGTYTAYDPKRETVGVVPFRKRGQSDHAEPPPFPEVLVRRESIPAWKKNRSRQHSLCCIRGGIEDNETPTEAARRELHEESGYDVDRSDMIPLGKMFHSKGSTNHTKLYTARLTGVRKRPPKGDGSVSEEAASNHWKPVEEVSDIEDPLVSTAILRMMFGKGVSKQG